MLLNVDFTEGDTQLTSSDSAGLAEQVGKDGTKLASAPSLTTGYNLLLLKHPLTYS